MVTSPMLDVMTFVLASVPIVAGLFLVLRSFRERSRVALARVKASGPTVPEGARRPASHRM